VAKVRFSKTIRWLAASGLAVAAALALATAAVAAGTPASAPHVAASQQLAVLNHDTEAFNHPSRSSGSAGEVNEVRPITGERTVLPVVGTVEAAGERWLDVLLPGRPNSHTGWIEANIVTLTVTDWRITVALGTRTVTVYDKGKVVRTFLAVVGKPSTPTPTGTFFVEETVPLSAAIAGTPFALALSARSNALAEFDGGPGQVALHGIAGIGGTPGTAVSHGCVRLETADIVWLAQHISSGVPVTITN
jgi:lipoprotein-anchoring transpeptidase ErfK/SrfK